MSRAWFAMAAVFVLLLTACASLSGTAGVPFILEPSGKGPFPGVIVLHTSGGLRDHEVEFASQLANQGYLTAVVDYLTKGGADNIDKGYDLLSKHPSLSHGRIGLVGFSLGATQAFKFSYYSHRFTDRRVNAIVAYYTGMGYGNNSEGYPPILFLHGSLDAVVGPEAIRFFCEGQKKLGRQCEAEIFEGVKHAFDLYPSLWDSYDSVATSAAFKRTVSFLDTHLKKPQLDNRR